MHYWEKKSDYKSLDYRSRNFSGNWSKHFINNYVDSLYSDGVDKTQQTYANYKNEHLPDNLYKFYPPTLYSLISVQNQSVYLSSPRSFNDPFDSYVCIETDSFIKLSLLKELKQRGLVTKYDSKDSISEREYWVIYHSWSKDEEMPRNIYYPDRTSFSSTIYQICKLKSEELNKIIDKIRLEARKECSNKIDNIRNMQFRISCFSNFQSESELLANTTMWSHYADNHQGFCVKYSLKFEQLENAESIQCGLFPVAYTSNVPKISPRELLRLEYKNSKLILNKHVLKTTYKALTTKSKFWNYEKEWRLIVGDKNSEIILNNTIPFLKVDTIYLGCRIEANLKKHLVHFAVDNKIKVYQSKQNNEKFTLDAAHEDLRTLKDDEFYQKLRMIKSIEDEEERFRKTMLLYKNDKS
jgi:hypothetical protein